MTYPTSEIVVRCMCGGLLDVVHDLATLRQTVSASQFDERLTIRSGPLASGVWRFAELIFPDALSCVVSAAEGNTNLYASPRLAQWVGAEGLFLKHEGENPTGSFKDRGMTVGMTHARAVGARAVVCASTGNTASSLASYAARGGLPALVLMPAGGVAAGKLSQTVAYGARTIEVRGDFDQAMRLIREVAVSENIYVLNSINPFRLEGQKSIAFDLLQQLNWEAPDWIVLPGGNLGNTAAFGKALREAVDLGLIRRSPRLAVIQAEGANPFYRAFRQEFQHFQPVIAKTVASAIKIGNPVNYPKAVRSIVQTNGIVEQVTDQEIMDAKAQVDAAGIGCEPASAASVAGVRKLIATGQINRGDRVVAILTGHLLKDPVTTMEYHQGKLSDVVPTYPNHSTVIEGTLDQVRSIVRTLLVS
ncbi:MAG TPA: threonine synthase [Chloroflexota bacterium]|nr:threonine synthase [Chloroflexota bacterium]